MTTVGDNYAQGSVMVLSYKDALTEDRAFPPMRRPTEGAENDLVMRYIEFGLPKPSPNYRCQIFIEPRVEEAFPDIVAAYWDADVAATWPGRRAALEYRELRVLHYLYLAHQASVPTLAKIFGKKQVEQSINLLTDAEVIRINNEIVRLQPMRQVFALRKIIAIEAKMVATRRGLEQAFRNTWFASESYLLSERETKNEDIISTATNFGVGLISVTTKIASAKTKARRVNIPASYASWYFNEWCWRNTL